MTGQVRWLCEEHRKLPRVTVMSESTRSGGKAKSSEFEEIKRHVEELQHLQQKFVEKRTDPIRKMPKWSPSDNIPRKISLLTFHVTYVTSL